MEFFFTFLDRSLAYDCVKCGQQCCRGYGLELDRTEIVRFARIEPRLAVLLPPHAHLTHGMIESTDGCWMLQKDGWCHIETQLGRAAKPVTCRLFPFNKITTIGTTRFVDFASLGCPLQDASAARTGQSWEGLAAEILQELEKTSLQETKDPPRGSEPFRWIELEARVRDAAAHYLDAGDYADFAAYQEEEVLALSRRVAHPQPGPSGRASALRELLRQWRSILGAPGEGGSAARAAARDVALLTSHFRLKL